MYPHKFTTSISVTGTRVDGPTAYVYIKFLSTKPADEHLGYFFCTENVNSGITIKTNDNLYYIDRYSTSTIYDNIININRNKTVALKFNLLDGEIIGNRFVRKVVLHLKEQNLWLPEDTDVWVSDELTLASSEIIMPEIQCGGIESVDGKSRCAIKLIHDNARDLTLYNKYVQPQVIFYDKRNVSQAETVLNYTAADDDYMLFESLNDYENNVSRVKCQLVFPNGTIGAEKSFEYDTLKKFNAYFGFEDVILKCDAIGTNVGNVKNIYRKS